MCMVKTYRKFLFILKKKKKMFPYTDHENKLQIRTWPYCAPLYLLLYEDSQGSSAAVASVTAAVPV